MEIHFTKMHGLGNDFVVIDALTEAISLNRDQIRLLADRHFGIGCDQLLLLEPPVASDADVHYRIFNADGGEVEQCGNGARCVAVYLRESRAIKKAEIIAETVRGCIKLYCQADGQVTVNMGIPQFEPEMIPLRAESQDVYYHVTVDDQELRFGAVSMGNPHAVFQVDNVDTAPVEPLGEIIESHVLFPQRVNVGFMQRLDRNHIRLRVFERGVGETLACGTGACAAAVIGQIQELLDESVKVDLPGGSLQITWNGDNHAVMMTGPAVRVFEGVIKL